MTTDSLQKYIPKEGALLWVIDEAESITVEFISAYATRSTVLTNRFDIFQKYSTICDRILSDFTVDESAKFDRVIFPVSKEKLVTNYVISSCSRWLNDTGSVLLLGEKNEGIKSYYEKLSVKFPLRKIGNTYLGECNRPVENNEHIQSFERLSVINDNEIIFSSKPGIFSWKAIDQGSTFLIQTLNKKQVFFTGKKVIDLGCGWGYLAVHAGLRGASQVVASDNNIAATTISELNLLNQGLNGEAIVGDCATNIEPGFDFVVCNPPFHKGKRTESSLTEQFIRAARRLLTKNGEAFFVVNVFIPLEKTAAPYFEKITTLANNRQFKVISLRK